MFTNLDIRLILKSLYHSRKFLCLVFVTVCCLQAKSPIFAQPASVSSGGSVSPNIYSLTVLGPQENGLDPSMARYDFGVCYTASQSTIRHTFILRNDNHLPVSIQRLRPSCGCTSAIIGTNKAMSLPVSLAPGNQISVSMTIDLSQVPVGHVGKYVNVYLLEQAEPAATLAIVGILQSAVSINPSNLEFGKVAVGQRRVLLLSVTFDPDQTTLATSPYFVSVDSPAIALSDLAIVHVSTSHTPLPISAGTEMSSPLSKRSEIRTYMVSMTPVSSVGLLDGSVSISWKTPTGETKAVDNTVAPTIKIPIFGQVTGPVVAVPSFVVFGTIVAGRQSDERVLVRGLSSSARLASRVITGPYVTAFWVESRAAKNRHVTRVRPDNKHVPHSGSILQGDDTNSSASAILNVCVSNKAPTGIMQSVVYILTPRGNKIVIPVTANVVSH